MSAGSCVLDPEKKIKFVPIPIRVSDTGGPIRAGIPAAVEMAGVCEATPISRPSGRAASPTPARVNADNGIRDPRIAALLVEAERKWGRGALMRWGDAAKQVEVEAIPTGFPALDQALGIGGVPCGRITELFGPDSSGKQSLAASLVVRCQKGEGVALYLDMAGQLDPEQMRSQGVDFRSLLVARPQNGLEGLEMAIRLARSGGVKLIVVDMAAGFRTSAPGARPSAFSLALRRLLSAVDRNGIAFVFLNNSSPGPGEAKGSPLQHGGGAAQRSTGGQALRFFASVRLEMERRVWIRRGRDVIGCRSLVRVAKNKLAPPLREAEVDLLFYRFPPEAPSLQLCRPGRPQAAPARAQEARAAAAAGR